MCSHALGTSSLLQPCFKLPCPLCTHRLAAVRLAPCAVARFRCACTQRALLCSLRPRSTGVDIEFSAAPTTQSQVCVVLRLLRGRGCVGPHEAVVRPAGPVCVSSRVLRLLFACARHRWCARRPLCAAHDALWPTTPPHGLLLLRVCSPCWRCCWPPSPRLSPRSGDQPTDRPLTRRPSQMRLEHV
jgi:hypothetical protein